MSVRESIYAFVAFILKYAWIVYFTKSLIQKLNYLIGFSLCLSHSLFILAVGFKQLDLIRTLTRTHTIEMHNKWIVRSWKKKPEIIRVFGWAIMDDYG